ncbi:MAG TPA: hypothetical protein VKW04_14695 [Planctomycetota bacterium]|nr:hypothetical protein [Planctomycetota bacterium]
MGKDRKTTEGGSTTIIVVAGLLGLGALGLVLYFQDQAAKAEKALLQAKDDYKEMQQRMRKPVEDFIRQGIRNVPKEESTGDLLTFLDRKAREAQIPPGSFTIARNATAVTGAWQESSYTVTLQSDKKDSPVKRNPVVDFLGKVERERRSTKTKSIQLTFAGDDLKSAIIGFSQFQPK